MLQSSRCSSESLAPPQRTPPCAVCVCVNPNAAFHLDRNAAFHVIRNANIVPISAVINDTVQLGQSVRASHILQ